MTADRASAEQLAQLDQAFQSRCPVLTTPVRSAAVTLNGVDCGSRSVSCADLGSDQQSYTGKQRGTSPILAAFLFVYSNSVARDGETNWYEGLMLLGVYVILAIAFCFTPGGTV